MNKLLLDTDIIVDYLRGSVAAKKYIDKNLKNISLSCITIAELHAGVKNKSQTDSIKILSNIFSIISIDEEIAISAGKLLKQYSKSHSTGLADALIAATADTKDLALVTFNKKHFPMLNGEFNAYKRYSKPNKYFTKKID